MAAKSSLAARYRSLFRLWPADLLRPNQPFLLTLSSRAARQNVALPEWATHESSPASPNYKPGKGVVPPPPAPLPSPAKEAQDINTLFTLLENRYSKKYPLSAAVLKPESKPEYYDKLMEEIERAPKKSWWEAKVDEWKGKVRWS